MAFLPSAYFCNSGKYLSASQTSLECTPLETLEIWSTLNWMLILAQAAEESKFFGSQADWTRGKVLGAQKYRGPHEGDTQLDRGDRSSFTHCSLKHHINNM